ncbi:Uncharacterized protein PAT23_1548 [Pseudomonas aeruginosa]|nr:hypothetical protein CSB94_6933 [Pseudomonas aeruginosa]QEN55198.1 Uncharacterized protein PAT23_1548 [Pseudomonas aeruginosa]RUE94774.1 malic enzyme [Pseudomonas aeruginosa]
MGNVQGTLGCFGHIWTRFYGLHSGTGTTNIPPAQRLSKATANNRSLPDPQVSPLARRNQRVTSGTDHSTNGQKAGVKIGHNSRRFRRGIRWERR